ncbi:MAG TPA: quinone-dependent dihydroorotate dehydrogenase [Candidatus Paceibacterota bacterium]
MNETRTYYRNKVVSNLYRNLLKPVFFHNDPEFVHDCMTGFGAFLGRYTLGQRMTKSFFDYENSALIQDVLGISFRNPIGLSAGFDKNAELVDILPSVGFGFAEIGSITGNPCLGNAKPRLWRLPKSKSLLVYYGLKNDGCVAIAEKLHDKFFTIPMGMSIAMTNCEENLVLENAIKDYAKAFATMEPFGNYITINISCPNALGGQPFIAPDKLEHLLDTLDKIPSQKPIFIKLSPDLSNAELDALLDVARRHRVHGIICTNLSKKRDNPKIIDAGIPSKGGFSGKVVQQLSDDMLSYIYKKEGQRFILVGCGGVFTAEDAYKKIRLGASLVQLITGMIFEGPQVISQINQGLAELLKRDGFANIKEAVGVDSSTH